MSQIWFEFGIKLLFLEQQGELHANALPNKDVFQSVYFHSNFIIDSHQTYLFFSDIFDMKDTKWIRGL